MAEPSARATVALCALNQARVPQEVIERAKAETARIYDNAGITVLWQDRMEAHARRHLIVNIVRTHSTEVIALRANNSHSHTGIMRSGWDQLHVVRAIGHGLTFSPEETALIQERLVAGQGAEDASYATRSTTLAGGHE